MAEALGTPLMSETSRTIAVTGGAGRVGRLLASSLGALGHAVRILDLPQADFDGLERFETLPGDICDFEYMRSALAGADVVVHLAALLPPVAEERPELTHRVNVEGTENTLRAMDSMAGAGVLVFSSSVVVYGNTQSMEPPITTDAPLRGAGAYAESKIAAEEAMAESGRPAVILRISGVSVPDFLLPPEVWPFTANQRMEFVQIDDVAAALTSAADGDFAAGTAAHNIAGGESWRLTGRQYSDAYLGAFQIPSEEGRFLERSEAFDFYDIDSAVEVLGFSPTPFGYFLSALESSIAKALS